jgi:RimJ/RimL family protein N-acetyltransferase
MNQPLIETERLILRPFEEKDAKSVQKLAGNKEVSKTTLNIPYPYKDGMAEAWISTHRTGWENRAVVVFAATDKGTKGLLGTVSLVEINGTNAELGYWFGEPYWNQGYCTEAAKALIEFAFAHLGITKIMAEHLSSNQASGRVMRKLGMLHVKQEYKPDRDGRITPIEIFELSRI